MTWKAMVHSATGTRHEQRGQPCQDYGRYRLVSPYLLGAVADGAGSALYADVGARLAVETALTVMAECLPDVSSLTVEELSSEMTLHFKTLLEQVVATLEEAAIAHNCELRELGCTLLVFMASPDWVAAMQIGDGFMVVGSDRDYRLLFAPDKGEFINETVFVTTPNAAQYMTIGVEAVQAPFICAATDGLERVAIRLQDWQPHGPFFQPFEACLRQLPTVAEQELYLKTFLESDRLNAKTDDDKTLLACLYVQEDGIQEDEEAAWV